MLEAATTILKEATKEKLNIMPFDNLTKRMSPSEILYKSEKSGIIGNYAEVSSIENTLVSFFLISSIISIPPILGIFMSVIIISGLKVL